MGQKTVRFSDLSGQLIMRDDVLARIVIHEHPDLGDGPVEIETLADEAMAMEKETLRVAVLDVYLPDGDGEVGRRDADGGQAGQAGRATASVEVGLAASSGRRSRSPWRRDRTATTVSRASRAMPARM